MKAGERVGRVGKAPARPQTLAPMNAKGWSIPHTSRRVFAELETLPWEHARVLDVGAGRGAFSKLVGEWLAGAKGVEPRAHLFACDLIPESFEYVRTDGRQRRVLWPMFLICSMRRRESDRWTCPF